MDQSAAAPIQRQATGEQSGLPQQPFQTHTQSLAAVPLTPATTDPLQPAGLPTSRKRGSENLHEPCESQLQVSLLPDRQYDTTPAVGGSKVPDDLQSKFAAGSTLGTEAIQEALQDLVSLLTDPM